MDRRLGAIRSRAGAKTFDEPHRIDAGFGRHEFVDGTLPLGLNIVTFGASAVDALIRGFRRRHGGIFSKLAFLLEERVDFVFDFFFALGVEQFFAGEEFFEESDGIPLFPVSALVLRNVFGRIVLRVATAAESFGFDKDGPFAGTGAFDRLFGSGVHRDDIVAIDDVARDAIGFGAVSEIFEGHLAAHRRGIGPQIIFEDQHERGFLRRGQIQAFMENASGTAAVTDPGHSDDFLADVASGHGDSGHHRDEIAKHGDGGDNVEIFEVAEMTGAIFAFGGRSVLSHVLGENIAGRNAFDEQRANIADHGRHPVALFESVGGADGDAFLAEAGIEATHDLVLAEEPRHGVFDFAIEAHVVVEVEVLLAGKFCSFGGSFRNRHDGWLSGPKIVGRGSILREKERPTLIRGVFRIGFGPGVGNAIFTTEITEDSGGRI